MDQSFASDSRLISYTEASRAQLAQALFIAREALNPYYPDLTWSQWHKAFEDLQPVLKATDEQISLTVEGFTKLAWYFEAQLLSPTPLPCLTLTAPSSLSANLEAMSNPRLPSPLPREVKKTYSMHPETLELLNRVSFWRREGKSALVNLAVTKLLADYAEAQYPLPITEA